MPGTSLLTRLSSFRERVWRNGLRAPQMCLLSTSAVSSNVHLHGCLLKSSSMRAPFCTSFNLLRTNWCSVAFIVRNVFPAVCSSFAHTGTPPLLTRRGLFMASLAMCATGSSSRHHAWTNSPWARGMSPSSSVPTVLSLQGGSSRSSSRFDAAARSKSAADASSDRDKLYEAYNLLHTLAQFCNHSDAWCRW